MAMSKGKRVLSPEDSVFSDSEDDLDDTPHFRAPPKKMVKTGKEENVEFNGFRSPSSISTKTLPSTEIKVITNDKDSSDSKSEIHAFISEQKAIIQASIQVLREKVTYHTQRVNDQEKKLHNLRQLEAVWVQEQEVKERVDWYVREIGVDMKGALGQMIEDMRRQREVDV